MSRIALSAYALRIQERLKGNLLGDPLPLDSYEPKADFIAELKYYLDNELAAAVPAQQKRVGIGKCALNGRRVSGVIDSGSYGFEADLVKYQTGKRSYRRQLDDAEMLPFYFLFDLPKRSSLGLVLLQRFQQFGVRASLGDPLIEWFRDSHPNHRLGIHPIVLPAAWDRWLSDGNLKEVRLIRLMEPDDWADNLDSGARMERGRLELSLIAGRNGNIPLKRKLREVFTGQRPLDRLIEIPGFPFTACKVVIEVGGTEHTVDVSEPLGAVVFPLDDQVSLAPNGHPDYDSIHRVAQTVVTDLRRQVAGLGDN